MLDVHDKLSPSTKVIQSVWPPKLVMKDLNELTLQEKIAVEVSGDPARIWSITLTRTLSFFIPSIALVIYAVISQQTGYGLVGYGILLMHEGSRLIMVKQGLRTRQKIAEKNRAKRQEKEPGSE